MSVTWTDERPAKSNFGRGSGARVKSAAFIVRVRGKAFAFASLLAFGGARGGTGRPIRPIRPAVDVLYIARQLRILLRKCSHDSVAVAARGEQLVQRVRVEIAVPDGKVVNHPVELVATQDEDVSPLHAR